LTRIEERAFSESGFPAIIIPSSGEMIGRGCFCGCVRLQSVTFESRSRLRKFSEDAFERASVSPVLRLRRTCTVV
jgi:hypothetical protein